MFGGPCRSRTYTPKRLILSQVRLPISPRDHWGEAGNRTLADAFTVRRATTTLTTPLIMVPEAWNRTCDLPLTRRLLCQLSYKGNDWLREKGSNLQPPAYEAGDPPIDLPRN